MRQVDQRNKQARDVARQTGRATYQHEVIEMWIACTDCGDPIRHNLSGGIGIRRSCGCIGRVWTCDSRGWRHE